MLLSQSCDTHFEISVKTINQDTSNVSSVGEKSAGKYVNYRTSKRIYLATNCFREQTILRYVIRSMNVQSTLRNLPTPNIVFSTFDSTNILCNKEDTNATSKATAKAGAYGGAELGSAVGNSICCCCGGIIGNCIGEKYGERAVNRSGLQERAGKVRIV